MWDWKKKSFKISCIISLGKNKDYSKWKKIINEIKKIVDLATSDYLESTNYLPPLGHVIAYVRYDALRNYYESIKNMTTEL